MKYSGKYLREKSPKVYFYLVALINSVRRVTSPYTIYITDSLGGSFKEYLAGEGMMGSIPELKRNLDKESVETIDVIVQRLLNYPDERFKHRISRHKEIIGGRLPVEEEPEKEAY